MTTTAYSGPDFEKLLLSALSADATLAALVSTKIYALRIPNGTKLPCVTFQRINGIPANTLGGHSGLEKIELQIDAWGRNLSEAKSVAKAVRGAMPATGAAWGAHLITDADYYEDGTNYYRISMTYACWFLEGEY